MAVALNKHQQKTEATRSKFLDAALRVFSRDGFERSSLEDIAAEAGHTRGAFYANFATKEDLFIALLEDQASKRVAEVSHALEDVDDPVAFRQTLRNFYLSRSKDSQWHILTLEFKLYALRHPDKRAQFAAAHQRIRESFQLEFKSKIKPASKQAKIILEVALNGLMLEHAYDPNRVSREELTQMLGNIFDLVT